MVERVAAAALMLAAGACTTAGPRAHAAPAPEPRSDAGPVDVAEPDAAATAPSTQIDAGAPPPAPAAWSLLERALELGCFAWSPTERTVACVIGGGSIQGGHHYELAFFGRAPQVFTLARTAPHDFDDAPLMLDARARGQVRDRLIAGDYVPLPEERFELEPGEQHVSESPPLRLTFAHRKLAHVRQATGSWDLLSASIVAHCARPARPLAVLSERIQNPTLELARVRPLDDRHLLIELETAWAIEGDSGGRQRGVLFDAVACRSVGSTR